MSQFVLGLVVARELKVGPGLNRLVKGRACHCHWCSERDVLIGESQTEENDLRFAHSTMTSKAFLINSNVGSYFHLGTQSL